MAEDLHLGGMSQRTHDGYLRAVRQLADHCQTAPDKISEDQLRRYFLFLKNEKKFAYGSLRVAYSGIKFFYTRTCKRKRADAGPDEAAERQKRLSACRK